jgi:hypothetical protein
MEKAENLIPQIAQVLEAEKSFTEEYLDYAGKLTDAPEVYHEFLALNLLSLAVGRTPINITPCQLYPNIWTILIGISGVSRKSSALSLALSILPDEYEFLPNDFTPESLQQSLAKQSHGLICKEEIGGFLQNIKRKDFMSGTADLLCQLYDCPPKYNRTLRSIEFRLSDVCFNIMAATTPSRFANTVKTEDFDSGFLSRFLIIYGEKKFSFPRRSRVKTDTDRRNKCRTHWKQVYDLFHNKSKFEFEFDDEALEWANTWQTTKEEEVLELSKSEEADLKGAIVTRLSDYVLKLSALYEVDNVSELVESPIVISLESVRKACSIIDRVLTLLTNNILTLLTEDDVSRMLEKLTNKIRAKADSEGWVQHRTLLPLMNMDANKFRIVLQTAFESNLIETKQEGRARYYKLAKTDS